MIKPNIERCVRPSWPMRWRSSSYRWTPNIRRSETRFNRGSNASHPIFDSKSSVHSPMLCVGGSMCCAFGTKTVGRQRKTNFIYSDRMWRIHCHIRAASIWNVPDQSPDHNHQRLQPIEVHRWVQSKVRTPYSLGVIFAKIPRILEVHHKKSLKVDVLSRLMTVSDNKRDEWAGKHDAETLSRVCVVFPEKILCRLQAGCVEISQPPKLPKRIKTTSLNWKINNTVNELWSDESWRRSLISV